jgi:hypothetical protein
VSNWLIDKSAAVLEARTSRRGFLVRAAVAGTALAVSPLRYLLRPVTAYAAICGCGGYDCNCGSACCDGYTAFCCEVNNGHNACPAGSFPGGWWRADGSTIVCRMATCEPPYLLDLGCSGDTFWDNATANHSADCSAPIEAGKAPTRQAPAQGEGEETEDRDERSRQRDEERAARQAERDAERAQRQAERDAERAARNQDDEG